MEISKTVQLCGGEFTLGMYNIDQSLAQPLFEEIYQEGLRLQSIFNFFDKKSELSQLNTQRAKRVSTELFQVVNIALQYSNITKGSYDITKGKNFLERKKKQPFTTLSCSYKDVQLRNQEITLKHQDILIDLGSIAKGFIADKLIEYMQELGIESGYVDARGDMRIYGPTQEVVGIQHPRDKDALVGKILIRNSAVATSGDYRQYDTTFESSHIVGPVHVSSVTVQAPTVMEADVVATCLMLMNQEDTQLFLKRNQHLVVCLVDRNATVRWFNQPVYHPSIEVVA